MHCLDLFWLRLILFAMEFITFVFAMFDLLYHGIHHNETLPPFREYASVFRTIEEVKLLLFLPQPWFSWKMGCLQDEFPGNFPLNHTSRRKDKKSRIELVGVPTLCSKRTMLNYKPQQHSSKKSKDPFLRACIDASIEKAKAENGS